MLRLLLKHDDAGMAANVGGSVLTTFKTFDVEAPEVEAWLKLPEGNIYAQVQIIGVELVKQETDGKG